MKSVSKKLNELASTAICGNDISSSVLYVSALAIMKAGQYAWVTLLIVSVVLFLFRKIYGEVVGALPLNGGAYNALLNTTSKSTASFAATLTLLSYMATAVISGNEGIKYFLNLFYVDSQPPNITVILITVGLLAVFALLVIGGISESAKVAIAIFIIHLISLVVLFVFSFIYISKNGFGIFQQNWESPMPQGSLLMAIFLGFAASMLGVSGFESSANFVEEQEKGVFPKTLRNMWGIVSVINPLAAILALAIFTIPVIQGEDFNATLLVHMGNEVGGKTVATLIAIDAFLVLSGAVLTSFVGVSGLLERMTLDRIMPQFFLKKNSKGSSYRIIIMFLILCISVLIITEGNVELLAGVYTISFLSVMALFGIGNVLLKVKRNKIPRPEKARWISVFIAIIAVLIALYGNIIMPPKEGLPPNWEIFAFYFFPAVLFIIVMLNRTVILKLVLNAINAIFDPVRLLVAKTDRKINRIIDQINSQEFVFFTKGDKIDVLNKVMLYISNNEHTKKLKIVTVLEELKDLPEHLPQEIDFLDREYPLIDIEFVVEQGKFSPELIEALSERWNIPINFMFIGSPSDKFPFRLEELGGVRLII